MQKLHVKIKDRATGDEKVVEKNYIRSFDQGDGQQVWLSEDGTYCYKTGDPVRTRGELETIIGSKIQRDMALNWWDRFGHKISEKFWEEHEEYLRGLQGNMLKAPEGDVSSLDMVLYQKRPTSNRSEKSYSDPLPWHGLGFIRRPDWWGVAKTIEMGDWYFRRVDLGEEEGEKIRRLEEQKETGEQEE